jgi:hypothetical protein
LEVEGGFVRAREEERNGRNGGDFVEGEEGE